MAKEKDIGMIYKKKLLILTIIILLGVVVLFIYEETMFSLDAFEFDLQHNILRPSQVYVPDDTASELSASEVEGKLVSYGMDERIVRDMDDVKKREFVCADQIEVRVSYFKINRAGRVKWITQVEAETGCETNRWMYFKKSDFVFTLEDDPIADKHEIVTEIQMLSKPRWRFKYELAVGTFFSSVHLETAACKQYEYSAKQDEISVKDLSNKLTIISSDMYDGVRLVDKFGATDVDELLWCVNYRFGYVKEEAGEFTSQLSLRSVILR